MDARPGAPEPEGFDEATAPVRRMFEWVWPTGAARAVASTNRL